MAQPAGMVDVRDMVCAQALARVAKAFSRLPADRTLAVAYNAEDVKRDVQVWAAERGVTVEETASGILQLSARGPK